MSLLPALTHLFQFSCYSGSIPNCWKKAIVRPLLKSQPADLVSSYRPISLTATTCKILERKVYDVLNDHLSKLNFIPECQYGFRKGKSTTTQLLGKLDDWTNAVEQGSCVDIFYADFAKVFDSIPHNRLLSKLKSAGILGALLSWLSDFLRGRFFSVMVDSNYSNEDHCPSGVPQGSILGPLLFIFYISDLPEFCRTPGVIIKLFADDLNSSLIHKNLPSQTNQLQLFIQKLQLYCHTNGLRLQPSKCAMLYLSRSNKECTYILENQALEHKSVVRDLGIHISSDLKWNKHVSIVTNKALGRLFLLFKSLNSNDHLFLVHMFKVYVRSILDYGSSIFNSNSKQNINLIENVQKRFTRYVFSRLKFIFPNMPSYAERLSFLNLCTLENHLLQNDLILFHRIILGEIYIDTNYPTHFEDNISRSNPKGVYIPNASKNSRRDSFFVRLPKLYLKLPIDLTCLPSNQFAVSIRNIDVKAILG